MPAGGLRDEGEGAASSQSSGGCRSPGRCRNAAEQDPWARCRGREACVVMSRSWNWSRDASSTDVRFIRESILLFIRK
jgi:hypothetical protein